MLVRHLSGSFPRMLVGALLLLGVVLDVCATTVAFLNPGKSDEKFWVSVTRFMQSAATDLRIDLETLYAERDPTRMINNARAVLARPRKPDYLVVVNEKQVAPEIIRAAHGSGINIFLLLNALSAQEKKALAEGGSRLDSIIGSIVPDNEEAGFQMAERLIREARRRSLVASDTGMQMVAISGDRATAASVEREAGLRRALNNHADVRLMQLVYGEWSTERAREQMEVLIARYPEARLVWSANDIMAFGAMEAAEARRIAPGRDMVFAGLNNSSEAMRARANGRLSVLAAGHFAAGGWAMVMIHDHAARAMPAKASERERRDPLFMLLDERQAARFLERFGDDAGLAFNFRQFSLAYNRKESAYRFSLSRLLE
jgi:ABC-type sugar transport system substrate-binding protein